MGVAFFRPKIQGLKPAKNSWDNQDIADFYRAVDLLKQAGINVEVDSGVTDEGDPWFVFCRPENGDVVAHFAQIDGYFVAVSSLNQEMFRGTSIRAIVDQMIERHPLLLPKSGRGGRLLLHPTAAITAFLAAAFILNIDGIKASNIGQVIAAATSQDNSTNNDMAQTASYGQKLEPIKAMLGDLNVTNYNVAILGVALIAHELANVDSSLFKQVKVADYVNELGAESNDPANGVDVKPLIDGQQQEPSNNPNKSLLISEKLIAKVDQPQEHEARKDGSNTVYQNEEAISLDFAFKDSNFGAEVVIKSGQGMELADVSLHNPVGGISTKIEASSLKSSEKLDLEQVIELANAESNINTPEVEVSIQIQPLHSVNYKMFSADGSGADLKDTDGYQLVGLRLLDSQHQGSIGKISNPFDPEPFSASVLLEAEYQKTYQDVVEAEPVKESTQGLEPFKSDFPILGHSLSLSGENVQLTNAVDVVFYTGGNSEITNFELGKDLLWFFLPPEKIAEARNSVNSEGDVILDFGNNGTLTFLGMLSDQSLDVYV